MNQITVGIPDFCNRIGVRRTKAYQLIAAGELETVKIGRRTLITVKSIKALLARHSRGGLTEEDIGDI